MFRKKMYAQLRRVGSANDDMQLDQFKIRRRVDVMQLKKTFKNYIMPKAKKDEPSQPNSAAGTAAISLLDKQANDLDSQD